MEIHPAANLFPPMTEAELADLSRSIDKHGQYFPIIVHEGKILDGRNRWRACQIVNKTPWLEEWKGSGDPADYVVAANLERRHLSESQRAMVGARLKSYLAEAARERQATSTGGSHPQLSANLREGEEGKASDLAAERVKVSGRSVEHAAKVLQHGTPQLVAAVEHGEIPVSVASSLAELPAPEQETVIANGLQAARAAARKPRSKPDSSDGPIEASELRQLKKLWRHCSDQEREIFLEWMETESSTEEIHNRGLCRGFREINNYALKAMTGDTSINADSPHKDQMINGLTAAERICEGLNGLDIGMISAACTSREISKWFKKTIQLGEAFLNYAEKLKRGSRVHHHPQEQVENPRRIC